MALHNCAAMLFSITGKFFEKKSFIQRLNLCINFALGVQELLGGEASKYDFYKFQQKKNATKHWRHNGTARSLDVY